MRILIVKISSMGDVIHNLPIIEDIRTHFPDAEIDWVVEENFIDIVALHPKVSRIIPIAFRRWRHHLFTRETFKEVASAFRNLRKNKYDYILDTQGLLKSVLICLCARGPRFGRDWQSNREAFASLFYQHRFRIKFNQHAVNRGRQLAAMALGYSTPTTLPNYGLAIKSLTANINSNLQLPKNYIMYLHATSRDSKLWPIQNWIELGQLLAKQGLAFVLPWANDVELMRANTIATKVPNAVVLPKLDLNSLAAITAGAQAAIGVDTGLIHLAVALNVPSIAIYIDSQPDMNGALASSGSTAINLLKPSTDDVYCAFQQLNIT